MKKRKYASGSLLGTSTANSFGFNRTPTEKVVYGDPTQDPLQRVIGDITGSNIKGAINDMYGNLNTNVAPIDNDTLMDRLYNTPRYQKMNRVYNGDIIAGLPLALTGTLPVAAGFRYGKGAKNGVFSVDWDNMMAAGQGAMNGSSYGPYGIAAGAILGGLANYASQLGINKRVGKWNNAVDTYNLAQNSITDQLLSNSKLSQMNDYNARYAKLGGPLNTHGGNFQNGLFEVVNGGTHEQNPYEGVPMGMDEQGNPNLVEEGEYVWNDNYVFSKRMQVPDDMRKKYKLGGKMSYADVVDKVQKESEERPNDPISKRGLNAILTELAMSQEVERQKQQQQEAYEEAENIASMFADGGGLNRKDDYGSKKKPYPSVKKKDFAGGGRSYPIPTKTDAIDALRLAGLHHRPDVKAKVYRKYPELKHAFGGNLHPDGGPIYYDEFGNPVDNNYGIVDNNYGIVVYPDKKYKQRPDPGNPKFYWHYNYVPWSYTYKENYPKEWNNSLYGLEFFRPDALNYHTSPNVTNTNGIYEVPDVPDINNNVTTAPKIKGEEIIVTNPDTIDNYTNHLNFNNEGIAELQRNSEFEKNKE